MGRAVLAVFLLPFALLTFYSTAASATNSTPAESEPAPETAREYYNAGTRLLRDNKFREAETYLESCLGRQDAALRPSALYNLGHTRFAHGAELLEKAPNARRATERVNAATAAGVNAIEAADRALANPEVQRLVDAYMQGGGARRELNAALKAVAQALEAHGEVLKRWQRAADDFRSAAELNPADARARENAAIVDRHIAKLIDQMRAMAQAMMAGMQTKKELGEKMREMRGQIPDDALPPGAPGEGEEEEFPDGLRPGMQEGASKSGEEQKISPDEAGDILQGFRLDGDRRLPMGGDKEATPKDPKRKTW